LDQDLDEELRAHMENRADDLERSGLSRAEAERRARIEFGGSERFKEECRESMGSHLLYTFLQDVRFAVRVLRKSPGFTLVAVLTLALGIGANTAIFSLIDSVMLRLLPVREPQQLVQLLKLNPARGGRIDDGFTNALWEQVRDHQNIFSDTLAWSEAGFDLSQGGAVNKVDGIFASGSFFNALGVAPIAGRLLTPADDQRGCPAVAVLGYGFWREHFGGAAGAVGSTLSLNRHPFQVIGVSAAGFNGAEVGDKFDVAVPLCSAALFDGKRTRLDIRDWWWLEIVGRLKPGISPEQLAARLKVFSPQAFAGALPPDWGDEGSRNFLQRQLVGVPAATGISDVRTQFGEPLVILMVVTGMVLLIACANLASFMLARAASRNKEIAVRKALGASRGRLIRQLLTECLLLSSGGALLGILLARWGTTLLVRYISTTENAVFLDLSPDLRVLGFTAGIALVTALLFGIFPALRSSGVSLTAAMKDHRAPESLRRTWFRVRPGSWIVAWQVALSLVLVVVAGLFLRSLVNLATVDPGFDRSNVLLMTAMVKPAGVPLEQRFAVYEAIEARLRALPGVVSAGRSDRMMLIRGGWSQPVAADVPGAPRPDDTNVWFHSISPGYLETLRTPLLAGRNFTEADSKTSGGVAIVNQTFVHEILRDTEPLGRYIQRIEGAHKPPTTIQIVGVVKDSKYSSLREAPVAQAFFPISQLPDKDEADNSEIFAVRTAMRPAALISAAQDAVAGVNKGVSLKFRSLAQQVDDSMVQERLLAALSGFFGILALLLALIGLYGTLSYRVHQRQAEFALRVALGAPRKSILGLVLDEVAAILVGGALAGIAIAMATVGLLERFLFRVPSRDPATLVANVAVLAAVAIVAAYLPARRAMRIAPSTALRYE
jgi:predicted permease